jgi:hypothetical protein
MYLVGRLRLQLLKDLLRLRLGGAHGGRHTLGRQRARVETAGREVVKVES